MLIAISTLKISSILAYYFITGWCGTIPRPKFIPKPKPDPWPYWHNPIVGLLGGIGGGFFVTYGLGIDNFIGASFGAFAGGRILSDLISRVVFK